VLGDAELKRDLLGGEMAVNQPQALTLPRREKRYPAVAARLRHFIQISQLDHERPPVKVEGP
jgi:hypothetical protein